MKINIIFALENTCNVLCNSIIRGWKIMRYTRFIIMRSRVQSPVPLQKKHFGFLQNAFLFLFACLWTFYCCHCVSRKIRLMKVAQQCACVLKFPIAFFLFLLRSSRDLLDGIRKRCGPCSDTFCLCFFVRLTNWYLCVLRIVYMHLS